ncbi:MAG: hypothetical protein MK080_10040 [Opitutales bacterium]|nr:hypothetical protein [Opitutales bacterium]NRA28428.1 hypothetical protein [Opitutales bacterium]
MASKIIALCVFWIVSLAVAFFFGLNQTPLIDMENDQSMPTNTGFQINNAERSLIEALREQPWQIDELRDQLESGIFNQTRESVIPDDSKRLSSKAAMQTLKGLLSDPSVAVERSWALLNQIEPSDIPELLDILQNSATTGRSARQFRSAFIRAAMSKWARVDPNGALDSVDPESNAARSAYFGIFEAVAQSDLNYARELLERVPDATARSAAYFAVIEAEMVQDTVDFVEVGQLISDGLSTQAGNRFLSRVLQRDEFQSPAVASKFISSLENTDNRRFASDAIAHNLSNTNPELAANWALTLDTDLERESALQISTQKWIDKDIGAAAEWLNQQGGSADIDPAYVSFARRTAHEDPEAAMSWAEGITQDEQRNTTVYYVARRWLEIDQDKAQAFAESSAELTEEQRNNLMNPTELEALPEPTKVF